MDVLSTVIAWAVFMCGAGLCLSLVVIGSVLATLVEIKGHGGKNHGNKYFRR